MADAMAASSGGVDWTSILKPFLSANYETSNKAELLELCSAIIKSESEILRHKETNKNFLNSFTLLASDYISNSISGLSISQLEPVCTACKVLLKYLIGALQTSVIDPATNAANVERYLNAIHTLCIGTSLLSSTEFSQLVDVMKGENLPPQNNPTPTGEKDSSNKQESSKARSDLSVSIFEQLTLPLRDGHTTTLSQDDSAPTVPENPPGNDSATELRNLFLKINTENLQSLRVGDTLIDLCLSLPSIKRAKTKVDEFLAGKPFTVPTSQTEAATFRNGLTSTVQEINLATSALNLPVLEPLTPNKLEKICSFATAILYLASGHATASAVLSVPGQAASPKCAANAAQAAAQAGQTAVLKEDDFETNATTIVEETLNLYIYLGRIIKESTRAGGHVYQNYLLAGSWILVGGLQAHLAGAGTSANAVNISEKSTRDTTGCGRSPCKAGTASGGRDSGQRSGLQKFQQSFGVLSVALATKMLNLFAELFEDLNLEVCGGSGAIVQVEPAPIAIMGQFSALQRVARILTAAPLNHLMFYLAIVSYRKACSLKRLNPPDGDTFSQSDSTTYYEDMIMCSDEGSTDEDDDSEPILGHWFEATLAPPESSDSKTTSTSEPEEPKAERTPTSVRTIIPEKGDATGYIILATNIFVFLNRHFICSKCNYVIRYVKNGLTENQMIILSAIVRDLDREPSRTDLGGGYFAGPLGQLYCEFSGALTRFTHNLITNSNLNSLQPCLLNHLGVSPWNNDVPHAWPLQVYSRTLGILAQVLLLRPQNEKEASVISIWHRLVNTLIENVLNPPQTSVPEGDNEDLNVEHAQVLLYLFHSLNLMQKKSVVLLMAGGVLRCSEVARGSLKDIQLLHLSRLLLLFDYIMKHLYDAPKILLDQIQWHLFYATHLNTPDKDTDHALRAYLNWGDVESSYRKLLGSVDDFYMKPRFYILTYPEESNPDMPKLDGLACNFVLGTPDKLRYPLLIDALIEILNVTNVTSGCQAYKMTPLGQCAAQYCFSICWKLLLLLPPSASYMERLASGEHISPGPLLLYSLVWGPRTSQKHYSRWLKDCLVKQGMYTQNTDKLLKGVSDTVNNLKYDLVNAKNCILALTPEVIRKGIIFKENLPPLWHVFLIDALLAKVQISLEDQENNQNVESSLSSDTINVQDLLPLVLKLAQHILHCNRWGLVHWAVDQNDSTEKMTLQDFEGLQEVLAITSTKNTLTNSFAQMLNLLFPACATSVLAQWNEYVFQDLAPNPYKKDVLQSESYILMIVDLHIGTISSRNPFSMNYSLKRFLQCLVLFICEHAPRTENTDTKNKAIELLVAITLDSRTEHLMDYVTKPLEKMIGDTETDEHQKRVYWRVLDHTYRLILNCTVPNRGQYATHINEKILHNCLKFYERIIEKSSGRQALEAFFTGDKDLVKVLLSVSSPQMSQQYSSKVLHFFNKLFTAAEKSSTDPSLNYLCSSMSKLAHVDSDKLLTWLRHLILGSNMAQLPVTTVTLNKGEAQDSAGGKWTITAVENKDTNTTTNVPPTSTSQDQKALVQENSQMLQALTSFIVKQNSNVSEEVSITILKALTQLGTYLLTSLDGTGFPELMVVMTMLANAGSGRGHIHLFPAAGKWIALCAKRSTLKEILDKIAADSESIKTDPLLEAAASVMEYVSDAICVVTTAVLHSVVVRPLSPPWESESPLDPDQAEWKEDAVGVGAEDEGDSGEDSDEDSLCNQLCTFTVTQKEFMNQHWYHCHTCRMLDGVGVCSVCARVCHKGHDVTYAKYGNFFCDCGAKEDLSCQALFKRNPHSNQLDVNAQAPGSSSQGTSGYGMESLTSLLRRRTSSPSPTDKTFMKEKTSGHIVKQLEGSKEYIIGFLCSSMVTGSLIEFLEMLIPSVEETCNQNSPVGSHTRGVKAMDQLYSKQKKYVYSDQLMVPTLGSQEGAFENVRMSYAGEQGQQIRQLLSTHFVRRVAMCCMTSTQGRRQHLAVSHEKGKITVLQLSALLKQADSSTRKLTLTRLASAPIPFTVLSLSSNLCNEDFLAVCGLKECHILTFTAAGAVSNHLVLHSQLEIGNFIVKTLWLPGSQTQLALVTADFVKIYDLGVDASNPTHYFLVPSGKIRDCTFMYENEIYHILLMSSAGHIYTEILSEESSTKFGTFYVTNTLEVYHLDVVDVNGQVAGGGVSIYYSHTLGLLFYSYAQGKSFISPIIPKNNCLPFVFPITLPTTNGTSKSNGSSRNSTAQPLVQWTEIPNHPGLICAAVQSTNNPVIIMLKPNSIIIQEIKVVPVKSKIMDMVAIRHNSGNDLRTTLILLCEDGSLKMYMANMEQTGFWMSSYIQATIPHSSLKPKKKKVVKSGKSSNSMAFPVDFFEHCNVMNDVEWGGNDLLQIYNHAQLKHRLHTTGLYITCNRPLGFTVEVTNNDPNMVMVGLRVMVGSQDLHRVPAFIEVFGRIIPLTPTRCRWYDIAFTREESLQADKKFTILIGPSQDPETVTIVDTLKIYGKTKDVFGWPEENDENASSTNGGISQAVATTNDAEQNNEGGTQLTKIEKLAVTILESLDAAFTLYASDDKLASFKPSTIGVATKLLTLPTPPSIQVHSKALLASLHNTRQLYHAYKDQALLQHVLTSLNAMLNADTEELDAESYYRLVLIVRGIAVSRPQNLVKFTDSHTSIQDIVLEDPLDSKPLTAKEFKERKERDKDSQPKNQHLLLQLMDVLWILHSLNPEVPSLAPVVVKGLKHTEQVIHALVEIVHAFNSCDSYSNITIGVYLQLLLCEDPTIAYSAKQALGKVLKPKTKRRRVYIPSPPRSHTPPSMIRNQELVDKASSSSTVPEDDRQSRHYDVDSMETIAILDNPSQENVNMNPLEALLGGTVGFQPLLDIPPDADDETMVELAIALSLQASEQDMERENTHHAAVAAAALHNIHAQYGSAASMGSSGSLGTVNDLQLNRMPSSSNSSVIQTVHLNENAGNMSDTTASAAGSDDEGSTAATDGSTLRTSPAEQGGSAGSESGGSGVESITGEHNASGRSSAYGDTVQDNIIVSVMRHDPSSSVNLGMATGSTTTVLSSTIDDGPIDEMEQSSGRLPALRIQLLERLAEYLPRLKSIEGVRAVPFLQVVLQLTTDLDGHNERDRACLNTLLSAIIAELQFDQEISGTDICARTKQREIQLILMRLLSVFMQRCKSSSSTAATKTPVNDNSTFVCRTTATALHKSDIISYCNKLLQSLLIYWRSSTDEEPKTGVAANLLKEQLIQSPPDMTPFFQRQFVKDNQDVFKTYPQLLTEIILRLPYQVHRHAEVSESIDTAFHCSWYNLLCDYMMTPQTPFVRRQVRKLLMFICGNKEVYRQLRDQHSLRNHMKGVRDCCIKGGFHPSTDVQHALSISYDSLVELMEHLKFCVEVAQSRTGNWQRFCIKEDDVIQFLIRVSFLLDEGVAPTILQLLQCALVVNAAGKKSDSKSGTTRKDREKSDDSTIESLFEESSCVTLVEQINNQISREVLARFIKTFMLETNITSVRWQAHALVQAIYKNSKPKEQESILELLWQLWPQLSSYGKKAAQFVDLLGYFSLKFIEKPEAAPYISAYVERAICVLKAQNEMLSNHPNANLYAYMARFIEIDGFYIESDPCLVCNNPEVPFTTMKLSSLKVDSKFTTTTQIVKLLSSHTISKITVRIGDLKRTKMVRTINIFYNNRSVQAVVELKNKPALWHKAKKVTLASGQTEVKIEFPLPIIACNLMIEYGDFYENVQASSETLQCPRCSASVPANPGVCANCGENVYQCHKCRAINYDEKDPFLCHACGFCKYAKFDFSLLARPCFAIEPIENDEDRKKTVSNINTLLEKADRVYKQIISNKPTLEMLVGKITEYRYEKRDEIPAPPGHPSSMAVAQGKINKTIQMLAQQYCNECKNSFEELSKIIQKILVSRKELLVYDRKHRDAVMPKSTPVLSEIAPENIPCTVSRCYGCSTAAIEHCLTLLKALAYNTVSKQLLCSKGLVSELVWNNLRSGGIQNQEEIRQLLCLLTKDNFEASDQLCNLLLDRISLTFSGNINSSDLGTSVRHEVALFAVMAQNEDSCWELKLRYMIKLFMRATKFTKSPLVMESIILPCLKIFHILMKPIQSNKPKPKEVDKVSSVTSTSSHSSYIKLLTVGRTIDVFKFVEQDPSHEFYAWSKRNPTYTETPTQSFTDKEKNREFYLQEKYFKRWKIHVHRKFVEKDLELNEESWVKAVMFNPCSRLARQFMCSIIESMGNTFERKLELLKLLTLFLFQLNAVGESSSEFLTLYQSLIIDSPYKQYLTSQGVLVIIAKLMTREIEQLHKMEEVSLTSDLTQGYALSQLTEVLASFMEDDNVKRIFKTKLTGAVLNGYLSLRRLVVQRTRLVDETQEKLLELLEDMTSGNEEETKAFMEVCIKTVEEYSLEDILTPVFIFERLCSIIYPEENDVGEFFLTLEKDPQQEDFLQGRMLGNPYSSLEAGMGPLMRDVKNKICQDCELVALLEDDNGMELLVNNKIMSLDLPVKEVYKKVWVAEGGDHEAMRVIYRMRGLLGDATEEFVETLSNKSQSAVDNEEVYKMANVLADCGGLQIMVTRLGAIQSIVRARPLVQVLLKLFRLCVKVNRCQEVLIKPEVEAMEVFLRTLKCCLDIETDSSQANVTEQLLDIMETVLSKATSQSLEEFLQFSHTFGSPEYVKSLLTCILKSTTKYTNGVLIHLTRVLAALAYGSEEKMKILLDHFTPVLHFDQYDEEHTTDDRHKLEMFCVLTNGIEKNAIGSTLKDYIINLNIVQDALDYIKKHAPCVKPTLLRTDSDELKDFISKPALKYILRVLTGLAYNHELTQLRIASAETIPIIHRLEQVSSDEHVGSLAENLLEALCTNPEVAKLIDSVRNFTRSEKKRLAMAMREKQLGQLGMSTNDKGQVTAKSAILQQIEELGEESGLVCCICREGYKYQPAKVLGIYTFTKRCNVEEFETKPRKTVGYTTVTHFNVVHIDCHMSAVRLARARDEWESAALQNANTRCNGLLPLWGPQVPESAFASCLARHNTYLQESTNHRDIAHASTVHDMKLLLLRFAQEKSFHDDTGGGGPQSNMHMIPYLIHVGLYVINTTRIGSREETNLLQYLENNSPEKWVESAYDAEGPLFWATMSLLLHSTRRWEMFRVLHLRRILVLSHVRHVMPSGPGPTKTITDREIKSFDVYKPYCIFFGLINGLYERFFKNVSSSDENWPNNLADYIRHNDEALLKATEKLMSTYSTELLPCTSFAEFCDVTGLLEEITEPEVYMAEILNGLL